MSGSGVARRGRRSPKSTRSDTAPYVPCPGNVVSFVTGVRRAAAASRDLSFAFVMAAALTPVLVQPATAQTVTFPRGTLVIDTARGDARFEIEIARTEAERSRGLMYRGELAPDAGMLFLFDPVREANMWMRNTFIALDMLFIAPDGRITGIAANTTPLSDAAIASGVPVRAVLELAAGTAARRGIKPGDRVRAEALAIVD